MQVRFHIYYTTMKSTLITTLALLPIFLFAQWPTDLHTGLLVAEGSDSYEIIRTFVADNEDGYYFTVESNAQLYIQHLSIDGTTRWDVGRPNPENFTDEDIGWGYEGLGRGDVLMAVGQNDEVWVCWEDFRHASIAFDGYPTNSEIFIQKFNTDRVAQWEPETAILVAPQVEEPNQYTTDFRHLLHIEPQSDGSIMVLWKDYDRISISYEGNLWVQRFDVDGNRIFEEYPGKPVFADTTWNRHYQGISESASDGEGGLFFGFRRQLLHLLPTGQLDWDLNSVVIDTLQGISNLLINSDSNIFIEGNGRTLYLDNDNSYGAIFDFDGNLIVPPTNIGLQSENADPGLFASSFNEDFVTVAYGDSGRYTYRFNNQLEITCEVVLLDTIPIIHTYGYAELFHHGFRIFSSNYYGYQETDREIIGYDIDGNMTFAYHLDDDSSNIFRPMFTVDNSGNTWIFWNVGGYDFGYPPGNLYANVISPDGDWGLPYNSVDNPSDSNIIPQNISLNVYPNPGNGQFTVTYDLVDPSPAQFLLTNVLGQRIQAFQLPRDAVATGLRGPGDTSQGYMKAATLSLDLKDQASGTYFLQVRTESGQVQQRRILLVK